MIMTAYASDPIRLNFELLFLCKSIVKSEGSPEGWDAVAEKIIARVQPDLQVSRENIEKDEAVEYSLSYRIDEDRTLSTRSSAKRMEGDGMSSKGPSYLRYSSSRRPEAEKSGWFSSIFGALGISVGSVLGPRSVLDKERTKKQRVVADPGLARQLVQIGFSLADSENALIQANNDEAAAIVYLTRARRRPVDTRLAAQLSDLGFAPGRVRAALILADNDEVNALEMLTGGAKLEGEEEEDGDGFELVDAAEVRPSPRTFIATSHVSCRGDAPAPGHTEGLLARTGWQGSWIQPAWGRWRQGLAAQARSRP
jgi:hypothetical protein